MYIIGNQCIGCGICEAGCPAEAISMGEAHREIYPEVCISCGNCYKNCPVEAIAEA